MTMVIIVVLVCQWAGGDGRDGKDVFVSIEPIQGEINSYYLDHILKCGWVIVGAETGNRKGIINPKKEWIDFILRHCEANKIPIFMKESLHGLMGDDFRQEFPWEV